MQPGQQKVWGCPQLALGCAHSPSSTCFHGSPAWVLGSPSHPGQSHLALSSTHHPLSPPPPQTPCLGAALQSHLENPTQSRGVRGPGAFSGYKVKLPLSGSVCLYGYLGHTVCPVQPHIDIHVGTDLPEPQSSPLQN